ncbi:zinc finger protein 431 [Drosophila biarmipes]|uniref:zinc finger protein 431 n=1 Tax=Drosophila biarmipes TaxID=125945 RepID=UPI0007E6A75B|nr:zinc finger protein 431 [Drosophila biarmipes]
MDNLCMYCKQRRGLSVKRGGSLPKTICLLCLHLDTFGTAHESRAQTGEGVTIKEEEASIEEEVPEQKHLVGEKIVEENPIIKKEILEEESAIEEEVHVEEPIVEEKVIEEAIKIKEEVLEDEPAQGGYFIITECLEEPAMETCLVCQGKSEHLVNIFDESPDLGIPIATMISQSSEMQVEKGNTFPETICLSCLEFVRKSYETIQTNEMNDHLHGQVKEEIIEDDLVQVKNEPVEEDPLEEVYGTDQSNQGRTQSTCEGAYKFHCYHCPMVFKDFTALTSHVQDHEANGDKDLTKETPHRCPHCPKIFLHAANFEAHVRSHNEPVAAEAPRLKCPVCPKIYFKQGNLAAHMLIHKPADGKGPPFKCPDCPKIFLYDSFFQVHLRTHMDRNNAKKLLAETSCPKVNLDEKALRDGIRQHADDTKEPFAEPPYKCPDCPEIFSNYLLFKDHIETHKEPPKSKCPHCEKSFRSEAKLQTHDCDFKPVKCPKCRKFFQGQFYLNYHIMSSHRSKGPYKCIKCQRVFENKSTLKEHVFAEECVRFFRSKEPGETFQCSQCSQSFRSKDLLKAHWATHKKKNRFKCKLCPKAFRREHSLKMHSMDHRKKSPYRCEDCPLSFITKKRLKEHTRTHKIRAEGKRKCRILNIDYSESVARVEGSEEQLNIAQFVKRNKRDATGPL